jgi:hypothetical protein
MKTIDPNDLRLHPLLKKLPPPDKASKVWESFVDNLHAQGPSNIEPLLVTKDNQIMSGGRRWMAAKQLGWDTIKVVEASEENAATIIAESLFSQRDLTRGAKVYLALELIPEYVTGAEARRLSNLKQNRKTFEKPGPKPSNLASEHAKTVTWLCERWGISDETFRRANDVRKLFASDPVAKAAYEPQLLSGEKNLWNVISGRAGEIGGNKGGQRPVNSGNQLELFKTTLDGLVMAVAPWNRIEREEHEEILVQWRKAANKMPPQAREELATILLEINQSDKPEA